MDWLKVMDAGEDVLKEMGQYPVISLTLKGMRNESLDDMVSKLRSALASACNRYAYLLEHVLSSPLMSTRSKSEPNTASAVAEFFELACFDITSIVCKDTHTILLRSTTFVLSKPP